jgi:hypothetical protein
MRSNELIEGVELVDSEGNVKGTSKIAAKRVGKILSLSLGPRLGFYTVTFLLSCCLLAMSITVTVLNLLLQYHCIQLV